MKVLFSEPPRWLRNQVREYLKSPTERLLWPLVYSVRLQLAMNEAPGKRPSEALASPATVDASELRPLVEQEVGIWIRR